MKKTAIERTRTWNSPKGHGCGQIHGAVELTFTLLAGAIFEIAMDPRVFETLGLGPSASIADVRSAYRKLARRYHPDVAGSRGLSKFAEISRAHDLLIQHLEAAREAPFMPDSGSHSAFSPIFDFQTAPAHGFSAPVREGGSDFIDDTISDIFEDIDNMISSIGGVFGDTRRR